MSLQRHVRSWWKRFGRDEDGSVFVYFTVATVGVIATVGLLIDGARYMTLHSQLQDLADAAALAGAAELDMTDTAIERATARTRDLLNNDPRFATLASAGQRLSAPVFYQSVNGPVTTNPRLARAIEVSTANESLRAYIMPAAGGAGTATSSARSVAGATEVACQVTPLMLCNPWEPGTFSATRGQMFRLKAHGGAAQYGPGTLGLLDPPDYSSSGSNLTRDLLASNAPKFCFIDGVSVRTGEATGPVDDGLNVRFDIYPNGILDPAIASYPPAPNVTKGKVYSSQGNSCKFTASEAAAGLPRDNCFYTSSCTSYGDNVLLMGDGDWSSNAEAYWTANHSTKTKPAGYGTSSFTRYDLYLWELGIANDRQSPTYANMPSGTTPENPRPQCYRDRTGSNAVEGARRRLFYVAVIDCNAYSVSGNSTPRMTGKYAKFFMTEPAHQGEVYAEYVDMIRPADDTGVLHHIVRLHR